MLWAYGGGKGKATLEISRRKIREKQ